MGEGEGGGGKVMIFKVLKSFPPPLYPVKYDFLFGPY
jgi:hypothetical protein